MTGSGAAIGWLVVVACAYAAVWSWLALAVSAVRWRRWGAAGALMVAAGGAWSLYRVLPGAAMPRIGAAAALLAAAAAGAYLAERSGAWSWQRGMAFREDRRQAVLHLALL